MSLRLRPQLFALAVALGAMLVRIAPAPAQVRPAPAIDQRALFRIVAFFYDLDPGLLEAIARAESGGNPDAISPAGAQGLMQLMPATARRFRVVDPYDPVDNALGAARFLNYLRGWQAGRPRRSTSLPEILAAYNAGPGAVEKYGGIPPYPETQRYVRQVLLDYVSAGRRPQPDLKLGRPQPGRQQRVVLRQLDPLEQLAEIRRLRAQAQHRSRAVLIFPSEHNK